MNNIQIKDHLGNKYPSLRAMARAYNIELETLRYRLSQGMDIKEALTKKSCQKNSCQRSFRE